MDNISKDLLNKLFSVIFIIIIIIAVNLWIFQKINWFVFALTVLIIYIFIKFVQPKYNLK